MSTVLVSPVVLGPLVDGLVEWEVNAPMVVEKVFKKNCRGIFGIYTKRPNVTRLKLCIIGDSTSSADCNVLDCCFIHVLFYPTTAQPPTLVRL